MNKYLFQTVLFAVIGLTVVGQLYLPIPILDHLVQDYHIQSYSPSWVVSLFGYCYALGFLFFGPLSDKWGKKQVLLIGMSLLIILTFWLAHLHSAGNLLLARGLQGFFAASFPPLILAYIGQAFPDKLKGIAVSAMAFGFLTAVIISQLFIVHITAGSLADAELIFSGIYLFALLNLTFAIKENHQKTGQSLLSMFSNIPSVLFAPSLRGYYVITFFRLFTYVSFYLIIALKSSAFIEDLFFIRVIGLPAMLIAFIAPMFVRQKGEGWVFTLGFSLQAFSFILAGIGFYVENNLLIIQSSLLIAASAALLVPTLIGSVTRNATNDKKGTAVALYTFILFCGASSAPLFISFINRWLASDQMLWLFAVFSLLPMIMAKITNK